MSTRTVRFAGRGRGLDRCADRLVWEAEVGDLPDGAVVVAGDGEPALLLGGALRTFAFGGWGEARPAPRRATVRVLTPPTSVAALAHGFVPVLHASATG